MNQGITLRFGASSNSLEVNSGKTTVFDLGAMDKGDRYTIRRTLIESLKLSGYFGRKEQRKAKFREKRGEAA